VRAIGWTLDEYDDGARHHSGENNTGKRLTCAATGPSGACSCKALSRLAARTLLSGVLLADKRAEPRAGPFRRAEFSWLNHHSACFQTDLRKAGFATDPEYRHQ
jgi:hypothetical protein